MVRPDATVVDLHSVDEGPCPVLAVSGKAWWGPPEQDDLREVQVGDEISLGDAVVLSPGACVQLPGLMLKGGNRGRAHALVSQANFQPSPNRSDVPRLVAQLEHIEREMKNLTEDPLMMQSGPCTDTERAQSGEFARLNFEPEAAALLDEQTARALGAVCLFVSQDTAFVAIADLTVPKLRTLMQTLDRPVNPHVVEPAVLSELLLRAYPSPT